MKKLIFGILCIFIVGGVMSICGGGNDSKPRTYVEAVSANDYVTAHAILDKYLQKAIDGNAQGYSFNYEYIEQFWGAADHIYKSEMMYLIEMNDQAANKRLINTLAMMNIIGTKPLVNESYSKYTKEYSYYIFVSRYNLLCDEILNISFLNNNREMASQVLMMYKEDAILRKKLVDGCEYYTFTFSYKSKEAATKKYNDAIKNGLLN
ncbi:MAG: hypothetical protein IKA81_04195 [Alistipes sp.]|nr:hypothetical protein [Alistipes sp.]